MQFTTIADVRSEARRYLYWYDRAGVLDDDQIDEIAEEAARAWWWDHDAGWVSDDELDELYELVEEATIQLIKRMSS
jgi:hypothetical protein